MNDIVLKQGDCLSLMPDIPDKSVDMILCDLPYGTTKCAWDVIIPFQDLWNEYLRIAKEDACIALFGQEPFSSLLRTSNISMYKYDIYWEKERLTNINQVKRRVGKTVETISIFYNKQCTYNPQMLVHKGKPVSHKVKSGRLGKLTDSQNKQVREYIDTGYRYPTQVWKYQRDCLTSNLHPTQKPIALIETLIRTFTDEGDTVLDCCMGSGSTGIACINTGRGFIGIELEDKYYKIAENRIKNHVQASIIQG